jgi:uncharacterized protein YqeY
MATRSIRERMQRDLQVAMKARDRLRVGVLRATLGAIANAEAVPSDARPNIPGRSEPTEVARRELTDADIEAVVGREVAELRADAQLYRERADTAPLADLETRIGILASYLR